MAESTSGDSLLSALQRFEVGFSDISGEEQAAAIEWLSQALDKYSSQTAQHAQALDAFRELSRLVRDEKSILACEALLKLLLSRQDDLARDSAFAECYDLVAEKLRTKIIDTELSSVCAVLNQFQKASEANQIPHETMLELGEDCASYFAEQQEKEESSPGRTSRILVERACWTTLVGICGSLPMEEQRFLLVDEVIASGVKRYFNESTKKILPLVDYSVERFEQNGKSLAVDQLSVVVITLIQALPKPSDRISIADAVASRAVQSCIELVKLEDKERAKAAFLWIKQLTSDALALLRAPEYPGAEIFLLSLESALSAYVQSKAGLFLFQVVGVELLGKMLEKIIRDAAVREKFWTPPVQQEEIQSKRQNALPSDLGEIIGCACGEGYEDRFMLDCDRCHRWFHANCVGVDENSPHLNTFVYHCDDCQVFAHVDEMDSMQRMYEEDEHEEQMRTPTRTRTNVQLGRSLHIDPSGELIAKRMRLVHDYLQFQFDRTMDTSFKTALSCYQDRTGDQDMDQDEGERSRSSLPQSTRIRNCMTRWGASRLTRIIAHEDPNDSDRICSSSSNERILRVILVTMRTAPQIALRKAAIEALGGILEVGPRIIDQPEVIATVRDRLQDESISVRDACLQYIIARLGSTDEPSRIGVEYRQMVLEKIDDVGLAVRKRAVELACKHLASSEQSQAAETLSKLCARLDDSREEQTVKDMIKREFLFYFVRADSMTVANTLALIGRVEWITMLLKLPIEESAPPPSTSSSISSKSARAQSALTRSSSLKPADIQLYSNTMAKVVEAVVQTMIASNEQTVRVSSLQLLKAFSKANANLLEPYLRNLVPWIAPVPAKDIAVEVCEIFAVCSLGKLDPETQSALESNLENLVFRGHQILMPATIRALENLFRVTDVARDGSGMIRGLQNIVRTFYDYLMNQREVTLQNLDHLKRAIYALALTARYHSFPVGFGSETLSNIAKAILGYYRKSVPYEDLRKRALQGVGLLLVRLPDVRIIQVSLFPALHEHSTEIRAQALLGFLDMLQGASELGNDQRESVLNAFVAERVQDIKRMLRDDDGLCRITALKVLQQLLMRGQVHIEAHLADLVSLERDPNLRPLAHAILNELFAKTKKPIPLYQGVLLSRPRIPSSTPDITGASPTVPSTSSAPPSAAALALYEETETAEGFADCYRDFMLSDGTPIKMRYEALKRLVENIFKQKHESPEIDWSTSRYLCRVLAALPYNHLDEILYVCYHLAKISALEASKVRGKLDPLLAPVLKKLAKEKKLNDVNAALAAEADEEVDSDTFNRCVFTVHIALAIRLKQHLQRVYRLPKHLIAEFDGKVPTMKDERMLDEKHSVQTLPEFSVSSISWKDGAMTARKTKAFLAQRVFVHLIQATKDDESDPALAAAKAAKKWKGSRSNNQDDEDQDIEDFYPAEATSTSKTSAAKGMKKRTSSAATSSGAKPSKTARKSTDLGDDGHDNASDYSPEPSERGKGKKLQKKPDDDGSASSMSMRSLHLAEGDE